MVVRRPLPSLLVVLALGAGSVSALDTTPRDLSRMTQVEFTDLYAHPAALSGQEVRFRCVVAARADIYDHLRSAFRPERYYALAVWDDRAPLWEPEARAAVSVGLFLHKDRFPPETFESLHKFAVVDVGGIIKEIIDGIPQIEVLEIAPVVGAGALTEQAVYHLERAVALQADARDLSEVHYQEALKVDLPLVQRIDVEVLRGRNLLASGQTEAAREVLEQAALRANDDRERTPADRASLLSLLAKALVEAKSYERAVESARAALALDPSQGEAYAVLGIGLAGLERYEEARRSCDSAVRLRPSDAEVRWYLGRILTLQKRYDESIDALKKAIDLTPKDHRIHLSIADAYRGRATLGGATAAQDLATALREVDITLRLKADVPEAQVLGGQIIEAAAALGAEVVVASGRVKASPALALERYQKALELAPASVPALVATGRLLVALGRPAEAQALVERLSKAGAVAEAAALQVQLTTASADPVGMPQRASSSKPASASGEPAVPTVDGAAEAVPAVDAAAPIPVAPTP